MIVAHSSSSWLDTRKSPFCSRHRVGVSSAPKYQSIEQIKSVNGHLPSDQTLGCFRSENWIANSQLLLLNSNAQ